MNMSPELPDNVVGAIRAGRKIEAIKLLREARGIDLREAKHEIEAYMRANPSVVASNPELRESGANLLVVIVIVALAGYLLYRLFV